MSYAPHAPFATTERLGARPDRSTASAAFDALRALWTAARFEGATHRLAATQLPAFQPP